MELRSIEDRLRNSAGLEHRYLVQVDLQQDSDGVLKFEDHHDVIWNLYNGEEAKLRDTPNDIQKIKNLLITEGEKRLDDLIERHPELKKRLRARGMPDKRLTLVLLPKPLFKGFEVCFKYILVEKR